MYFIRDSPFEALRQVYRAPIPPGRQYARAPGRAFHHRDVLERGLRVGSRLLVFAGVFADFAGQIAAHGDLEAAVAQLGGVGLSD